MTPLERVAYESGIKEGIRRCIKALEKIEPQFSYEGGVFFEPVYEDKPAPDLLEECLREISRVSRVAQGV